MRGYLYPLTVTNHEMPPLSGEERHKVSMLFEILVSVWFRPVMSTMFRLWWCLAENVQGGTTFVLHSLARTNHKYQHVCQVTCGGVAWERPFVILKITPPFFPFKVDQFKRDIKIKNNQVKKNTAKGYSIYIQ